ncbi:MAG: BlaI/MecI/CopY family transcriptional regulator [Pirellulales bacterium]
MARKSTTLGRLAKGELELLQMLWSAGPVSLIEAHRALGERVGYTTVQTRLNRLVAKRLARRSSERPARYQAAVTPEEVGASDLNLLIERVASGSVVFLVAHLVRDRSLTSEELKELKQLLKEAEENSLQSGGEQGS